MPFFATFLRKYFQNHNIGPRGGTLQRWLIRPLQTYNRQNTYQRGLSSESKADSSCSDDNGQNSSGKE
jgi:hypothetical protein